MISWNWRIGVARGKVYNLGGGPRHTISLRRLLALLEDILGRQLDVTYGDWRPGDQRVYVSDIRRAADDLCWAPEISVKHGVSKLLTWAREHVRAIDSVSTGHASCRPETCL